MMPLSRRRLILVGAFLSTWALVVVGRLLQIQVFRHDDYVARAASQQERTLALTPVRGSLLDARGRVLAESVLATSVYADPQAVADPRSVAKQLAAIPEIGLTAKEIETKLKSSGEFAWIARQLPVSAGDRIKALHLPGIYFLSEHHRFYPKADLASNLIGYVSIDGEGLSGVEHSFDRYVRGKAGKVTLLRDARKGMYLVGGEGANAPVDGVNVVLTIDEVIQFLAERALARAVDKYHAAGGSVIVMNPANGAILAMASSPSFDPNDFRSSPPATWRNRAVQDLYEPGSTFKIVTAAAAIEEGVVTPSQIIDCGNGEIQIANAKIHEHGGNKYGMIPFEDVIEHSSNVGTIRVGLALGPKLFYRYIRQFGFGTRTGVDLPGEGVGIVRPTAKWSQLSNAVMSIGQEIAVTPLQILQAACVIANGGTRVEPRIVERVVDAQGNVVFEPKQEPPTRVVSERTAAIVNEILKGVVARGTGQNAALPEHIVAGKTGTAQKAARGGYSPDKFVASFVGYVPADRPRLAILVVVDEPHGSQYGGTVAAPAFREIAEAALRYLGVPPSIPERQIDVPLLATISQTGNGAAAQRRAVAPGSNSDPRNVPDLRGLDARTAVAVATARGFQVRMSGRGVVAQQSPAGGAVRSADVIDVELEPPTEKSR